MTPWGQEPPARQTRQRAAPDESLCPLCGEPNGCAPAACGTFETPCWCASTEFPPELLERLDVADRGRSCLCPRCAARGQPAAPDPGPDRPDRDGDRR